LRKNIGILAKHHPHAVAEAMRYHRRIVQAVQQQDAQEARWAMQEHIEGVGRDLRELEAQGATFFQDHKKG
jgi:DNA-binding FadR family transcriptional regulator